MAQNAKWTWRIAHSENSLAWGGQEQRIWAELTGFRQRGHSVWLAAPAQSQIYQRALDAHIPAQAFATIRWQFPFVVQRLARWLKQQRIDIINPHSSRDSWLMGLAGRWANVPLIIRSRHFDVPIRNRWLGRLLYTRLCDHVLTTSPKISENLQALFQIPDDRLSTVPTGVDLERFSPSGPKAVLNPVPQDPAIPRIGLIAIIRAAKGHATLLDAAHLLRNAGFKAHYYFVGDGPFRPSLEQHIQDLHLADCVTFLGFRDDVPEVLRALDLLVMPSRHEGIPQVGLQALASKTPLIGSDVGGIPTIIRPGQTGRLFPPGDPPALARTIRQVFEESVETRRLAEYGRALIEANYSQDRMLDQIEELYRRYLGHDRAESAF